MLKNLIQISIVLIASVFLLSCNKSTNSTLLIELDQRQEKLNQWTKNNNVMFMDVDIMFPDAKMRKFAVAAGNGDIKTLQEMLDAGYDIHSTGKNDATPLIWAVRTRNINGFAFLLEAGANPNFIGKSYVNVLHASVYYDEIEFVKTALKYGADPNIKDINGEPVSKIALGRNLKILKMLLEAGADVNAVMGVFEISLLANSFYAKDFDAALWLINQGADYKHKNTKGKTVIDTINRWFEIGRFKSKADIPKDLMAVIQFFESKGYKVDVQF